MAPDAPKAQAARTKYLLLWLAPIAAGLTLILLRGRPRVPNQTSGQDPAPQDVLSRIAGLIEDARAQHTRVDTKASVLLGATGTLLAVVIAVLGIVSKSRLSNPGLPIMVLTSAWVGAALLAAALAHLAWAVRSMHTTRGGGSPTDPSLLRALADGPSTAVDHIRRELAGGDEAEIHRQMVRLGFLARHARAKHRLVRRATDLLLASFGFLIIAAVAFVLTR